MSEKEIKAFEKAGSTGDTILKITVVHRKGEKIEDETSGSEDTS